MSTCFWLLLLALTCLPFSATSTEPGQETATAFFNRVAGRVLQARLDLNLDRLEVYPQNQLTPEARRLLQITANLWDASHGAQQGESIPFFPTVFQPRLINEEGTLYLTGYQEVVGEDFHEGLLSGVFRWVTLEEWPGDGGDIPLAQTYFFEVPLLVGARSGFPNLNEIAAQSAVWASRNVEIRKDQLNGPTTQTNMMFVMGISNALALEIWYPYTNGFPDNFYPRPLELFVATSSTVTLTNDSGLSLRHVQETNHVLSVPARAWGGARYISSSNSFFIPPVQHQFSLPVSVYAQRPTPHFIPVSVTNTFEPHGGIFTNAWGLSVSNQVLYFLFDRDPAWRIHLVDAVSLTGLDANFDISDLLNQRSYFGWGDPVLSDMWSILPYNNITRGVRNQIYVSAGLVSQPSDWLTVGGFNAASGNTVEKAIAYFSRFLGFPPDPRYPTNDLPPLGLTAQTPFIPIKKMVQTVSWQADDPLVHYLPADLAVNAPRIDAFDVYSFHAYDLFHAGNLVKINDRYQPWGGRNFSPGTLPQSNTIDPSLTDPQLFSPDYWRLPATHVFNATMLGRVHRGTPWQTLYLKSSVTSPSAWMGVGRELETHPTNDWPLVTLLTSLMNTNSPLDLPSVNERDPGVWAETFAGMTVVSYEFTNCLSQTLTAESPQTASLVNAILSQQSQSSGEIFHAIEDLLSIPALSMQSPWLNFDDPTWYRSCLDDAAIEAIPAQLLPRLRINPIGTMVRSQDQVAVRFTGWDGYPFQLLGSPDFRTWQDLGTFQTTQGEFIYPIQASEAMPLRFFRIKLLP